jgi:hypothetical protein
MNIDELDLEDLRSGIPPANAELLSGMTQGRADWLDRFQEHYLRNFIGRPGPCGRGSKVKVLVGGEGTGKTHLLRCVAQDARAMGYAIVYLSLRDINYRLNNFPVLYRAIVEQIDKEALVRGLCRRVAEYLGYGEDEYDGSGPLLPLLVEKEGWAPNDARKEIRKAIGRCFHDLDVGPAFVTFCFQVVVTRMVNGQDEQLRAALLWLGGGKLDRSGKKSTNLFETLQKSNARAWLNSLIQVLNAAGMTGLVVLIDNIEEITRTVPGTGRHLYTSNAVKDTYEMFRQLIDDTDLLHGFVLIMAGGREIVEDLKRGFKSYEALWMRLDPGLVPGLRFNPYCDIMNTDLLAEARGEGFPQRVAAMLSQLLQGAGFRRHYRELQDLSQHSELRARVMETALLMERVGE